MARHKRRVVGGVLLTGLATTSFGFAAALIMGPLADRHVFAEDAYRQATFGALALGTVLLFCGLSLVRSARVDGQPGRGSTTE